MYPQIDKSAGPAPSAPPTYTESIGAPIPNMNVPQYGQYPPPQYAQNPKDPVQQQQQQQQQQPTQVIVVQATPPVPPLGPRSVEVTCPSCKSLVMSTVVEETSSKAYLFCLMLCVVGLWCCSCLPFCMNSLTNYKHSCPRCNAFFGLYHE